MALKSVTLRAGECVILPKDAVIESLVVNGAITATSDCVLPTPTAYQCGYFFFIVDADDNDGHSMDDSSIYTSVKVGSTIFTINEPLTNGGGSPTPTSVATLNTHITDLPLFEFMAVTENEVSNRSHIHLYFKTPASLYDTVQLKIDNRGVGSIQIYEPIDAECEVYENPA